MKPEFSKPFDLAAARAGAPFCCRDGRTAEILKWDGRRPGEPLIGFQSDSDIPASWAEDGAYETGHEGDIDLVMLPLGLIDGKPMFAGDEIEAMSVTGSHWISITVRPGDRPLGGRFRWPAPAKAYPVTTMRHEDMFSIYSADLRGRGYTSVGAETHGLEAVANAALRHAIDSAQVITAEQAGEEARGLAKVMADRRFERDMAVASAVRDELVAGVARYSTGCSHYISSGFDFEAIIAKIE